MELAPHGRRAGRPPARAADGEQLMPEGARLKRELRGAVFPEASVFTWAACPLAGRCMWVRAQGSVCFLHSCINAELAIFAHNLHNKSKTRSFSVTWAKPLLHGQETIPPLSLNKCHILLTESPPSQKWICTPVSPFTSLSKLPGLFLLQHFYRWLLSLSLFYMLPQDPSGCVLILPSLAKELFWRILIAGRLFIPLPPPCYHLQCGKIRLYKSNP